MNNMAETVWNTYGYVRLSCEEGDKEEINSVTGQKQLIRGYFLCPPELLECGMKVEDGFTGSNFGSANNIIKNGNTNYNKRKRGYNYVLYKMRE